jgi:DNA-binding winged helix-turn-helix (wHTH) protein/Tol biopolymer transport system component
VTENSSACRRVACFGEFELDVRSGELRPQDGAPVRLSEQPFRILLALIEHPNDVVLREELRRMLWPDNTVVEFEHSINAAVNRLRQVLGDSAHRPRFIETLARRGYRWMLPVVWLDRPALSDWPATSKTESADAQRRDRFVPAAALGVLTLLAGVLAFLLPWSRHPAGLPLARVEVAKLTDSGRVENIAIARDGRYVAYAQREVDGVGVWLRRLVDGRETLLVPPSESAAYRGLTFAPDGDAIYAVRQHSADASVRDLYAVPIDGALARQLVQGIDSPVDFSPDNRRIVYTRGIPAANAIEVRIADPDGSADDLLATLPDTNPDYQPGATWSPDGQMITVPVMHFRVPPRYALLTVDTGSGTVAELLPNAGPIGRALWLPGGKDLVLVLDDREQRGQLWTISYPRMESRRLSADLADYGLHADLTANGRTLVGTSAESNANVWAVSAEQAWNGRQLTDLRLPLRDVIEGPDRAVLARSAGRVWRFSDDGLRRGAFTRLDDADTIARCGPFVLVESVRNHGTEFLRFDADGANRVSLAAGDLYHPVCAPDGRYVYYMDLSPTKKIWRVSVDGGEPQRLGPVLGDAIASRISVSADGTTFAYAYSEFGPTPGTRFAIFPADGGAPMRLIDLPGAAVYGAAGSPLLAPDGRSVEYIVTDRGVSNVWEQPFDGGARHELTRFTSGEIFDFNWTRDGNTLLLTRGEVSSDAVLISGLRPAS